MIKKYFQFRGKPAANSRPEDIVSSVWPIKDLAEKYSLFINTMNEAAAKLDIDSDDGGGGLPFLHIYGMEFFEIIQDDPQLPLSTLPRNWPGLYAAKSFMDIRERILPKANHYIMEILSEGGGPGRRVNDYTSW